MPQKRNSFIYLFLILGGIFILCSGLYGEIKIYTEKIESGGYDLYGSNSGLIPYHIEITFKTLENLDANVDLPYLFLLPADTDSNYILSLTPKTNAKYSFNYHYTYYPGDPWTSKHDDTYLYLFPFAHGEKYRISQGYNGASTHKGGSQYALDFNMDIGTPIHAAREGLVTEIKEDSNIGGPEDKYKDYSNYVKIYHKDGSSASYVHLKQYGAVVNPGDRVKAGQLIGYSGNTGLSSGPHLHFAVHIPVLRGENSIPTRFLDHNLLAVKAQQGKIYYSTHPGMPPFEVLLAEEVSNEDYIGYSESIPPTDKIEFRTEKIDEVVLFFVKNGFNQTKKIEISFTLENMTPSKALPYTIIVPPRTEYFMLYLKQQNYSEKWSYKYKYTYWNVE